jgi:hypothetical protein
LLMDEGWVVERERERNFIESKGAQMKEKILKSRKGIFILKTSGHVVELPWFSIMRSVKTRNVVPREV